MRAAALLLGVATLVLVWGLRLQERLPGAFSAHMTMHVAVVAVAAPLLALAVAGSRHDPVRRRPELFPPLPLSVLELVAVWAFHAPALHHVARDCTAGLVAEQGTFLGSGLLVWLAAFGGGDGRRGRAAAGVVALLLTSMHMTLLGALLALAPRPLYAHAHAHAHGTGPDALADQHLGGAIMLLAGGAAYLAGGVWLTAMLLRPAPAVAGTRAAEVGP
jgi:putative membrane protein